MPFGNHGKFSQKTPTRCSSTFFKQKKTVRSHGTVVRNSKKTTSWLGGFPNGWWTLRFVPGAEASRRGRGVTGAAKSMHSWWVLEGESTTRLVTMFLYETGWKKKDGGIDDSGHSAKVRKLSLKNSRLKLSKLVLVVKVHLRD